MTAELIRHLWQSTFFAVAAGLLTVAFRKNRASVRYWLWLSASLKFFIPFALLLNLGRYLETWMPVAPQVAAPAISYAIEQFSGPFFPDSLPAPAPAPAPDTIHLMPIAILAVWLCGFAAVALIRFRNWLRVRAAVRASTATDISATVEVRTSPGLLEPGVVGLLRPILLLPEGIAERLTPSELNAVLAHELCHVRRRDNLFAAIHMIVEAILWFHPLVWWIGARLVEERERACDEEVLRQGNQPEVYADAILNVCKLYIESPLACVSGVSGASIRRRIETIMSNRELPGLNGAKKMLLATAGIAALAGPIAIGLLIGVGSVPSIHAQPPVAALASPMQLAQAQTPPPATATQPPAVRPKFDAATIKPCAPSDWNGHGRNGGGGGGGGTGSGIGYYSVSPGRLSVTCANLMSLISYYIGRENNLPLNSNGDFDTQMIKGGSAWVYSDQYTIEAETDDPVANGSTDGNSPASKLMRGPMLEGLLADRFQLKTHNEIEEIPMYALTVAKSGLKLKPMEEGGCVKEQTFERLPGDEWLPGGKPRCHWVGLGINGPNRWLIGGGIPLSRMADALSQFFMDRHILDKTGITAIFNIRLEYAPDENTPNKMNFPNLAVDPTSDIPAGPTIFTALEQQLGLKLVPDKGPRGYIAIDHVERPSEN